jgi:uncharacterized protein (TIGR02145 family)
MLLRTYASRLLTWTGTAAIAIALSSCEKNEPVASFTINPESPRAGETIKFTNTSEYATAYSWDFGDGNISDLENPFHSFTVAGTYTVSLTATGEGGENTYSRQVVISAPLPSANFYINPDEGEPGDTIAFFNVSSNANSYAWDFGDGATSTEKDPMHIYYDEGSFSVTLTATGEGGQDDASKTVSIAYPRAVADFSADKRAVEPEETIQFTNTSENAINYVWDFGDGTTSEEEHPVHAYSDFGEYDVDLTAIGQGTDNTNTTMLTITVFDSEVSVADYDGNVYSLVTIGSRTWTTSDLRSIHYPDGTEIPLVTNSDDWASLHSNNTDDAYCFYDDWAFSDYGAVYTWAAANKVCPEGFHLPDESDWYNLIITVSDHSGDFYINSGLRLKSAIGWREGGNGTDEYGFNGTPGVWREAGGGWRAISQLTRGESVFWWSESTSDSTANSHYLHYDNNDLRWARDMLKARGYQVRCVKD